MDGMAIGRLAEVAGVPVSTLRYYERRGLLAPATRTRGNYRVFDDHAVDRVRFIRAAQATGFTLDDVEALIRFMDGRQAACGEVRVLIERRLEAVAEQLRELRRLKGTLEEALSRCLAASPEVACEVVEDLRGAGRRRGRRKKT